MDTEARSGGAPGVNASEVDLSEVTVVIPAYNEGAGIHLCLTRLRTSYPLMQVIVVDDGSKDSTRKEAERVSGVTVISHRINRGYGAALKTGIRAAKTSVVAWYDGDGQHEPDDLYRMVLPVLANQLDAQLGVRDRGSAFVAKRIPGKWLLRAFAQIVARQRIPDLNCGLRAFRTDLIRRYIHLLPNGFSASATSTLLLIKRGHKIAFLPIYAANRKGGMSTVNILRDGFNTLSLIFRLMVLFDAYLFFSLCAVLQFVVGSAYSAWVMVSYHRGMPVLGALVLISGVLTFFMGIISGQISEMRQERFEFRPFER